MYDVRDPGTTWNVTLVREDPAEFLHVIVNVVRGNVIRVCRPLVSMAQSCFGSVWDAGE